MLSLALLWMLETQRPSAAQLYNQLAAREAWLHWPSPAPRRLEIELPPQAEAGARVLIEAHNPLVLTRMSLSPLQGELWIERKESAAAAQPRSLAEWMRREAAFSNTFPASYGAPVFLDPGERLVWKAPSAAQARLVAHAYEASSPPVAERAAQERAQQLWNSVPELPDGVLSFQYSLSEKDPAGTLLCVEPKLALGPRCVSAIVLRVEGPDALLAARTCIVRMSFDGQETVCAPLLALFRCVELDPRLRARSGRDYAMRIPMPYRSKLDFMLENLGPPSTHVSGSLYTAPWNFEAQPVHFGAAWLPARTASRLTIEGRGMLLGIAPALASQPVYLTQVLHDQQHSAIESGIARLDRLLFEKSLQIDLPSANPPRPQALALLALDPSATLKLREALPEDLESLRSDP